MKTRVIFIIDGSGSMANKASDVREGFNAYVKELKKDKATAKDITLSTVVFNTRTFPLFHDLSLDKVPSLGSNNYAPGGNTALYDAIGDALDAEKDQKPVIKRQSQYIVVIMTDGEENSSKAYGKVDIAGKIARREKTGKWTFVYLGADQNSFAEAHSVGIPSGQTYGGWGALDPLGGYQDLAHATVVSAATASAGGGTRSFTANLAATGTANTSRNSDPVPTYPVAVTSHKAWGAKDTYDPTKGVK